MSLQAWIPGSTDPVAPSPDQPIGSGYVKPKTKKALRDAVASGAAVWFTDTSFVNNRGTLSPADLSPSDVIVGPDAETQRNWYANIRNGKVV